MSIKAISTKYKGCNFRSRLEARWAVFFDALDLHWEYEFEGFDLPSGRYLPDFLLPDLECWIEIKPDRQISVRDFNRYVELTRYIPAKYKTNGLFLFGGNLDVPKFKGYRGAWGCSFEKMTAPKAEPVVFAGIDDWPMVCFKENELGEINLGYHKDDPHAIGRVFCVHMHDWKINSPRLIAAYNAARSARFEFGESGRG